MSRLEIDTGRTALLLLDLQNYNVHPDGYWASVTPGLVERVAPSLERTVEVLAAARSDFLRQRTDHTPIDSIGVGS